MFPPTKNSRIKLRRLVGRCLWTVVFLGFLSAAPAKEKWLQLQSEHFEMLSCSSTRQSKKLLVELEQFREFFHRFFPGRRVYEPKLTIVVFDKEKQFAPYKPKNYNGTTRGKVAAYYVPTPSGSAAFIAFANTDLAESRRKIFHECVHSIIGPRDKDIPLWLNEGLAEVFSSFTSRGDKVTVGVPSEGQSIAVSLMMSERKRLYSDGDRIRVASVSNMPLDVMLRMGKDHPLYIRGAEEFYVKAWLFAHYLYLSENSPDKKHLAKFLAAYKELPFVETSVRDGASKAWMDAVLPDDFKSGNIRVGVFELDQKNGSNLKRIRSRSSVDVARTFSGSFGIAPHKMDERLRDYTRDGRFRSYKLKIPRKPIVAKITSKPADPADVAMALNYLELLVTGNVLRTRSRALEVANQYPQNPKPHELLADTGASFQIREHLEKAAALNSRNAFVYYQLARYFLRANAYIPTLTYRLNDETATSCRELLDKAIELDPGYMEAHEARLLVEVNCTTMRAKAIQQSASALKTTGKTYPAGITALAQIFYRLGSYKKCRELVEAIGPGISYKENPRPVGFKSATFANDVPMAPAGAIQSALDYRQNKPPATSRSLPPKNYADIFASHPFIRHQLLEKLSETVGN